MSSPEVFLRHGRVGPQWLGTILNLHVEEIALLLKSMVSLHVLQE
jgi:hypothetical protein